MDYLRRRFLETHGSSRLHGVDPRGLGDAEEQRIDGGEVADESPAKCRGYNARTSTCQRTCRARITLCVDGALWENERSEAQKKKNVSL